MRMGNENCLIFVLGVFHQLQVSRITQVNAQTYAKWLANRFQNEPNIVWTMYPRSGNS